ncbi:GLPGLI family protein [Winogradskyella sp. UBA3174]|uniref:GLPGLI family protein n=1 Tax=Winogradskyella sp. UBA3174 TaxID=1947785 RepID=UPI0025DCC10A|nr:GLPGLI family protein [Winogradskyella sp. UBA3174]|tara:strand:+ start:21992 stop:22864 length:873 start_codon:yes stop_codon:yes gene_type:complete
MVTIIRVLVLALTFVVSGVNAQDFQGVATYRTQQKIDIKMDSTKMNSDMQTKMIEMMKKQFQKTYTLSFDKSSSIYQQEEELAKPSVGMGGGFEVVSFGGGGGSDVFYKNVQTQSYINQKETMGKIFLVKDSIGKIEWKLESDSKYIGEYQCYKATYTKQVPVIKGLSFSVNSKTNKEKGEEAEKEPEMKERIITAWYTPQIPVNNGPAKYQGLPGLILEVHDGKLTIICSKIVLNPEEKVEIKEPTKGKEVNQKEYDDIMDKKNKEMMERYAPKKGDRKGDGYSIIIGG